MGECRAGNNELYLDPDFITTTETIQRIALHELAHAAADSAQLFGSKEIEALVPAKTAAKVWADMLGFTFGKGKTVADIAADHGLIGYYEEYLQFGPSR